MSAMAEPKKLSPADLPKIIEALSRQDSAWEEAYAWLSDQTPKRISKHLPLICPAEMMRLNAAALMSQQGSAAQSALPQLVRLLQDDIADDNAARSLGMMGAKAQDAIPALLIAAQEKRPFAAIALDEIRSKASSLKDSEVLR